MKHYLRLLKDADVFSRHEEKGGTTATIKKDTILEYTREKRRNGINWMEIILDDGSLAYIKKGRDAIYLCEKEKVSDLYSKGFQFKIKDGVNKSFGELFEPISEDRAKLAKLESKGVTLLERSESGDTPKVMRLYLEYSTDEVDVEPIEFQKGDELYVTFNSLSRKEILIEVDDFNGRKGFLLKKTSRKSLEDAWLQPLGIAIMVIAIFAMIGAFLSTGWLVVSGLMIFPAVGIALVTIVVVQIAIMIVKGIVQQIRKRF